MNTTEAQEALLGLFERAQHLVKDTLPNDLGRMSADLIEWYNSADPDDSDLACLCLLACGGDFVAWACPTCDARVYEGSPRDWAEFQGVMQNDRTSYPGNGLDDARCDHCRCWMVGEIHA